MTPIDLMYLDFNSVKARKLVPGTEVMYLETDKAYDLIMLVGSVPFSCKIIKSAPKNADQLQFETEKSYILN